jgi:hypothetical protein
VAGAGIFSAGRQAGGDGEGKRRTGEAARVSSEWARMKLLHSVQRESRPGAQPSSERGPQFLFGPPRQGVPTFPFKIHPLGPPLRGTSAEPSVWWVRDFFPLGGRPVVTVKENGGREKQRG